MSNSLFTISEILPMIIFATFTVGIGVAIHFLNHTINKGKPSPLNQPDYKANYIAPEPKDWGHEKARKPVPIAPEISEYAFDDGGTAEVVAEQTTH